MSNSHDSTLNNAGCSKKPSPVANDQLIAKKEGFVRSDLVFYLKVAKATYYLKSHIGDCQWQHIGYNDISDVMFSCSRFFIVKAKESNKIIVAFRGTSKLKDVLLDINFVPKAVGDRHVHSGVFREANKLLQKRGLLKELEKIIQLYPESQIVFVGHSLGGSLASYLAWHITRQRPELTISVYTFGSFPCTSNPNIAEGQNLSVVNFVNKLDPVRCASWEQMSGAFHEDVKRTRHMFGKTMLLQDDIEHGGFFDYFQKEAGFSYHRIPSYSKAIENWFTNVQSLERIPL